MTPPDNEATLHGDLRVENQHIGRRIDGKSLASRQALIPEGIYQITTDAARASGGSEMKLAAGKTEIPVSIPVTGSWDTFSPIDAGTIQVSQKTRSNCLRAMSRAKARDSLTYVGSRSAKNP